MQAEQEQHLEVHRTDDPAESRRYGLVLTARRIPFVMVVAGADYVLAVRVTHFERAQSELASYRKENRNWPPVPEEPVMLSNGKLSAFLFGLTIVVCFLLDSERAFSLPWHDAGRADAGKILAGEWWRTITSLTLHSDLAHLASNAIFGSLFMVLASHLLGTGVGLLALLLSGMLGTLLNAFIQDPTHLSVGASTSVFGAIGTFVAFVWSDRRRKRRNQLYTWYPLMCGVFLLGSMGMTGVRTDVMAHATGFASGLLIGAILGRLGSAKLTGPELQLTCGIFAGLLVVAAWISAFVS